QIELPDREIVGGAPVGVHPCEEVGVERHTESVASKRQAARAIITSSSVGMTYTAAREAAAEITGMVAPLRSESIATPRNASPSQMRVRTTGACSPIPPENTSVSRPPSAAASAPMPFLI